jgi:Holliday junction resolvase RusA-like endonuclease
MALTLRIQRELVSPNQWNGRHWRVKHRISQEWEQELGWMALQWLREQREIAATSRMRLTVTREVPSGRNYIRDDDNLRFCVKPLLDAVKRLGLIKNDSRKWLELPVPEQRVSLDGQHWTQIKIEPAE